MKIHNCISVCTKKDAYTWSYASDRIVKYIPAEHYTLIVPSQQVGLFKKISNSKIDVIDEQLFAPEFSLQYVRNLMPEHKKTRAGWYYQQLLKIKALSQYENNTDINLIWDADTIPLREMNFVLDDKLVYFAGTENHKPYFTCTNKLMNLDKLVSFSFIAQNFVAKSVWVHDFMSMLSKKFETSWFDAILDNIDFEESSGFSEYETLGTYFVRHYMDEMLVCKNSWKRNGNEVCHIDDLDLYELCRIPNKPLFVSYELRGYSSDFQKMLVNVDDELLVSLIKDRQQSQKWQRAQSFSVSDRNISTSIDKPISMDDCQSITNLVL